MATVALMQLVDDGLVSLAEPVTTHLPAAIQLQLPSLDDPALTAPAH